MRRGVPCQLPVKTGHFEGRIASDGGNIALGCHAVKSMENSRFQAQNAHSGHMILRRSEKTEESDECRRNGKSNP